ncbi:MAG: nitrite/sulfite reductase [Acidipropionibacterium sp.]|jgi:sulfite reductase (ferredoxin)|nr:nitrite/sulfite reductase [Acidipropionibacterium sp.]
MPTRTAKRDNGQWAVSGRAPLNATEELKQQADGLTSRDRVLSTYAKEGFDSISQQDLYDRLKWWGVYTQRKQGIDGHRTATLTPNELTDDTFMMRVRIDGGQLTTDQTRLLGRLSHEFARDTADITDRQNIQYHWIRIEDVPEIWRRLEANGLQTTEACGDVPRGFLGSPVAGIAADEIIDPTPTIRAIVDQWIGDPQFSNLPRKFKTAVTGHPSIDVPYEINDISFVGVRHPKLGPGYDVWVGGALSTTPRLAQRLGVWVSQEEAPEVWRGIVSIFRDYGYRLRRTHARMKFLVDDWGVRKFRKVLEDEYLGHKLHNGGRGARPNGSPDDHIGIHEQKDGRRYVGFAPTVGRLSGPKLIAIADAAEKAGSHRIRLTPYQKLLVLDVDPEKVAELVTELEELGLRAHPSPFRRATMACTGIEYCKLAFVETKGLAARTIDELEERFKSETINPPISLNINGCPNSCARYQVADIGLKGQIIKGEFGFQVHLAGRLRTGLHTDKSELGRTVRGLKVTSEGLPDYIERVVRSYLIHHTEGQDFAHWAIDADEELLR